MGFESGSYQPTSKEQAKDKLSQLDQGKALSLYDTMNDLGDDPSYQGRVNFIADNEQAFVKLFNNNLQEGATPLDTSKDNYGYNHRVGANNLTYIRAYLKLKSGEVRDMGSEDEGMPEAEEENPDDYLAYLPAREQMSVKNDIDAGKILRTEDLAYRIAEENTSLSALTQAYPMALHTMTVNLEKAFDEAGIEPTETGAEGVAVVQLKDGIAEMYNEQGDLMCSADLFPEDLRKIAASDIREFSDQEVAQAELQDSYRQAANSMVRGGEEMPTAADFTDALYDEDDGVDIAGVTEEDLNDDNLPNYRPDFNSDIGENPESKLAGGWREEGEENDGVVDFVDSFEDDAAGEEDDFFVDKRGEAIMDDEFDTPREDESLDELASSFRAEALKDDESLLEENTRLAQSEEEEDGNNGA